MSSCDASRGEQQRADRQKQPQVKRITASRREFNAGVGTGQPLSSNPDRTGLRCLGEAVFRSPATEPSKRGSACYDAPERLVFLISPLAPAGISTAAKTSCCGEAPRAASASASWEVRRRSTAISPFLSAPSWRGRRPTTTAGSGIRPSLESALTSLPKYWKILFFLSFPRSDLYFSSQRRKTTLLTAS